MDQQTIFNLYVYLCVTIIAQSLLAWELGTKGWRIVSPKISWRVKLAILLFAGQVIWQRIAELEFPIRSASQAWPVIFPIVIFIYARIRPRLMATADPRLAHFLRAKKLYYSFAKRLGISFDQLSDRHFQQAASDPSLSEAEILYRQAIDLSIEEGWPRDAAIAKYQLGMLLHLQGKLQHAQQLFEDALTVLNEFTGDEEAVGTAAGCYFQIGLLSERKGDLTQASGLYRRAYDLETSIGAVRDSYASKMALQRCGGSV